MDKSFFLITAFGYLLACEKFETLKLYSRKNGILALVTQSLHFLWQPPILILLAYAVLDRGLPYFGLEREDWEIAILWLGAYLFGRVDKDSLGFFLATFSTAFYARHSAKDALGMQLGVGLVLAFGVILFQILVLGLAEKVRFSRLERGMIGQPSLLLIAAILTLVFWGFGSF